MSIFNLRLAAATACVALALGVGEARAQEEGLKLDSTLEPPPGGEEVPTFVSADSVEGISANELEASGRAEVHKGGTTLYADRIRYYQDREEILATGNVRMLSRGNEIGGPRVRYR